MGHSGIHGAFCESLLSVDRACQFLGRFNHNVDDGVIPAALQRIDDEIFDRTRQNTRISAHAYISGTDLEVDALARPAVRLD
mgnify:CR=1 FL=1